MLTDTKLRGLKAPSEGRVEHADEKVVGLRVRVSSKGTKTFILRKRQGAKVHNITLGEFSHRFGLGDARRKARALLNDLESGKSIARAKGPASGGSQTLGGMIPQYLATKAALRSHLEIKRILEKNVVPVLGDRLADSVTRGEVTELVDEIATTAPTMARAVHAQLSAFYSWAMPRLERLQANPCRDAGRPAKPKARDRVLNDSELGLIWLAAGQLPVQFGSFYRLLLLTAQRRDEVAGMTWAEVDRTSAEWLLKSERTKNGAANLVPLSNLSISVLDEIAGCVEWPTSGLIFTSTGDAQISGYSRAKRTLDAGIGKIQCKGLPEDLPDELKPKLTPWRVHDLRRTAATGFQKLGVRFEVTEAILNHVSGARGGVAGVYQRHDWKSEKRDALVAWGLHLQRLIKACDDGDIEGSLPAEHRLENV